MDSSNDVTTFVPPFELFPTELGSSPANNWVSTIAIGIKTKFVITIYCMSYFPNCLPNLPLTLLMPSTLCVALPPLSDIQNTRVCSRKIISFSLTLTTIPISGINDSTLGSEIAISVAQDNTTTGMVFTGQTNSNTYLGEFSLL